ncbi:hypothetical protein [Haliangium sp.]|uniref:hypothetical protein n=1 Tax=Haliangium sp. TaxID=2663208 RepID=UPI003D0EF368
MSRVQRVLTRADHVSEQLAREELEPDPARTDWYQHRELIEGLVESLRRELIEPIEALPDDALADDAAERLRSLVAELGGVVVAIVHASGIGGDARDLLAQLRALAPAGADRDEFEAAERDLPHYRQLMHGRWLAKLDRGDDARRVFGDVIDGSREPVLVDAARVNHTQTTRLRRAPALFLLNGFGLDMYGARDHIDDSYVSTHCVSALWLPVLPLAAYRVVGGDGSYCFLAKEPLSSFALGCRRLLLLAVAVLIAWVGISRYLDSPGRHAARAIELAAAHAHDGDAEMAISTYEALVADYAGTGADDELGRAGAALARLYCRELDPPLAPADVDRAVAALRRFDALPTEARGDDANRFMAERVLSWSEGFDQDSPAGMAVTLRLLDNAAPVFTDPATRARQRALALRLATNLAPEWPVVALSLYLDEEAPTQRALDAAGRLLASIGAEPTLMHAADALVERWLAAAADRPELAELVSLVDTHREATWAQAATPDRLSLTVRYDLAALTSLQQEQPRDQEIALALARTQAAEGNVDGAITTLTALGKPGWLIDPALHELAELLASRGDLAQADQLLTQSLTWLLPRMHRAGHAYAAKEEELRRHWLGRAQAEDLPPEFIRSLDGKSEAEVHELFNQWLSAALERDPTLSARKVAYLRYREVVSMALSLGTIKLRRAGQSQGEARRALLDEAERLFMSIRQDAEGRPAYHLALGRMYYLLDRVDEGEAQLAGVLARGNPVLALSVADTYLALGQLRRAREIAEEVWMAEVVPQAAKAAAVTLLASTAPNDDEAETWLRRANQDDPFIRTALLSIEARRLFREGRLDEADRTIAAVIEACAGTAEHDPTAANNAAVWLNWRYLISGRREHLARARDMFEDALRVRPDDGNLVGNAAETYELLGLLETLDRWLDTDTLAPDGDQAKRIIDNLATGPLGADLRALMLRSPSLRRGLELSAQQNTLMPSASDGYARTLWRHQVTEALDELRRMRRELDQHAEFAGQPPAERRWATIPGEQRERLVGDVDAELERLEQRQKRIGKRARTPTQATLALLASWARSTRAVVRSDVVDMRTAVAEIRRADELWPALGAKHELLPALIRLSILELRESSPAAAAHWEADRDIYSAAVLLHRAASGEPGAELRPLLRRHPAFVEAVRLAKDIARERPTVMCWVLGVVAEDRELERAGARVFADERQRLGSEIAALLDVNDLDAQARSALFAAHAR